MPVVRRLLQYLRELSRGRVILWCYAIWYLVTVVIHFDPRPRLWLTSVGLSAIIGAALILSTHTAQAKAAAMDPWVKFRLFLMPFCVSSFAALVKDAGYVLVFPPSLRENMIAAAGIVLFLLLVWCLKRTGPPLVPQSH
jgi:hypothetical protein